MAARSDAALRRLTLVAFAMYTVLTIVWSSGLAGRRGLAHPGSAIIDLGSEINFAALVLGGLLLTWLRPRNCIRLAAHALGVRAENLIRASSACCFGPFVALR